MSALLDLDGFAAARARLRGRIVETPMVRLYPGDVPVGSGIDPRGVVDMPVIDERITRELWLKLECLQVTGSFKARGALNRLLSLPRDVAMRGLVTASGGNHGLAVAHAGRTIGAPTTVYLPASSSLPKAQRIARWGATVVRGGAVWDEAHAAATAHAERDGLTYIHPFADVDVVAGQGTIALELFEQAPEIDLLIVAIGGGGLIAGIASAARRLRPNLRIVGVEPVGAPTLYESVRAGSLVELSSITTQAGTLAPRRSAELPFEIIRQHVEEIVLVTDDEMRDAAKFLLRDVGVGVELAGAAAVAAVLTKRVDLRDAVRPCALVCGAGSDAI